MTKYFIICKSKLIYITFISINKQYLNDSIHKIEIKVIIKCTLNLIFISIKFFI